MFHVPEKFRIATGPFGTTPADGNNGIFLVNLPKIKKYLRVIASDGMGWEHVSVSRTDRCPTWPEMCAIKSLFWDAEDTVVQYHPPESQYINNHPYCLHLWRPVGLIMPAPDTILVGIKL